MTRTPAASARESAIDLSILAAACGFGFSIAKWFIPDIPEGVEATGTAFIMAAGGALARYLRKKARSK